MKQRLVGAVVLVALGVIFLPMLVKGPAPDSGVSDVSLDVPAEPKQAGDMQTIDLPLETPAGASAAGATGMPDPAAAQPVATPAVPAATRTAAAFSATSATMPRSVTWPPALSMVTSTPSVCSSARNAARTRALSAMP